MSARRCTLTGCDCASESSRTASLRAPVRSSHSGWESSSFPFPPTGKRTSDYLDTLGYAPGFGPSASGLGYAPGFGPFASGFGPYGSRDPRFTPRRGQTSRYLHNYSPQVPSPLRAAAAENDGSYSKYRSAYQEKPQRQRERTPLPLPPPRPNPCPSSTSRLRPGDIGYGSSSPSSSYQTPTARLFLFPASPKPKPTLTKPTPPEQKRPPAPVPEPNGYHMQGTSKYHCLSRGAYRQTGALIHFQAWYEAQFGKPPTAMEKGKWREGEDAPLSLAEMRRLEKEEKRRVKEEMKTGKEERRRKENEDREDLRREDKRGDKEGMGSTYRIWKRNQGHMICKMDQELSFTDAEDKDPEYRQRLLDDYYHDLHELVECTQYTPIAKPRRRSGHDHWRSENSKGRSSKIEPPFKHAFPSYQDPLNPPKPQLSSSKHPRPLPSHEETAGTPQPPRKSRKANLGFGIGVFRRWSSGSDKNKNKNKARDSQDKDSSNPTGTDKSGERKKSGSSESKKSSKSKTSSESKKDRGTKHRNLQGQGSAGNKTSTPQKSTEINKRPITSFPFFHRFSFYSYTHTSEPSTPTLEQKIHEITEH